ncbi:MAG: hypothetical protein ACPGWR_27365 [Ardenticatenaceae bacterium]
MTKINPLTNSFLARQLPSAKPLSPPTALTKPLSPPTTLTKPLSPPTTLTNKADGLRVKSPTMASSFSF